VPTDLSPAVCPFCNQPFNPAIEAHKTHVRASCGCGTVYVVVEGADVPEHLFFLRASGIVDVRVINHFDELRADKHDGGLPELASAVFWMPIPVETSSAEVSA